MFDQNSLKSENLTIYTIKNCFRFMFCELPVRLVVLYTPLSLVFSHTPRVPEDQGSIVRVCGELIRNEF